MFVVGTRPCFRAASRTIDRKRCRQRHRFLEPIHNVKEGPSPLIRGTRPRKSGLHPWRIGRGRGPPSLFELRRAAFDQKARLPAEAAGAAKAGGASRDRTGDLKLAKLALSQLSYGPKQRKVHEVDGCHSIVAIIAPMVGRGGVEPPTSRLSGVRSNHLSYRPPPSPHGFGGQARAAHRRLVRHGSGAATAESPG